MHRSEDVVTHHTFVEHDSIFVVVTLPRHISHEEVATQSQFTVFSGITFGKNITGLDTLTLVADGAQVDGHVLIGTTEFGDIIFYRSRIKRHKFFVFRAVVSDDNLRGINVVDHAIAFGRNHRAAVFADLLFNACTHDGGFGADEGHSLAHHVRAHQRAVGIVVFKEGNKSSCNRRNLLGSYVHQSNFRGRYNRIVGLLTAFHGRTDKGTIGIQRCITLTDDFVFFFLSTEIDHIVVVQVGLVNVIAIGILLTAVLNDAVGRFDEAEVIDFGINAERRNQTDVRTFRTFNRAETAVVSVVHVAHLKTGTFTRQTAGTQCRKATLVGHFGQRVRLVHKLRQRVRTEERVDDARNGFGVNQISRSEHFVVTHIHAFADGAAHTCQTDGELIGKLFTHRTHTAVGQVVDVVYGGL